ncbi:putative membrane protein [Babesia divergens]|uniref:Membrane protein n=1 Tax=Babesia divergens TaxID=32595 RepID=A0AAD9LL91_BABDI|nr:putative membrane protein [Babesia divergens]
MLDPIAVTLLFTTMRFVGHINAFNMAEWAHQGTGVPDTGPQYVQNDKEHFVEDMISNLKTRRQSDDMAGHKLYEYPNTLDSPPQTNTYMGNPIDDMVDGRGDSRDIIGELKRITEQSSNVAPANETQPLNENATQDVMREQEKHEQPKIELPTEKHEHTKLISKEDYEISQHDKSNNHKTPTFNEKTPEPVQETDNEDSESASKNDLTSLIPKTQAAEHSVTSGNEDTIIDDTAPITHNLRMDTLARIDETINKLDHRLQKFLSAVSISAHDLLYYENLLDMAYTIFCKEINGDLGRSDTKTYVAEPPVNVAISAEMSSAIRRSFDTKIEVLELAASEVAAQKSKETGARTIHDALASGLLHVRSTIASPGLTIRRASTEMKTMTAIVEDMRKTLDEDVISATLMHNASKKNLFDKILERDEYMKSAGTDKTHIEKFTKEIHLLASKFHRLQSNKANAMQKQNGFKEYMDNMQEDINTIQRLIDTYFATVHNGHAKAIIHEAKAELNKDDRAESQLRLHLAEDKVRNDALKEAERVTDQLTCPVNYRPLHPEKPVGNFNPCVRVDKWV